MTLIFNTFENNVATMNGAAIYILDSSGMINLISNNFSKNYIDGDASQIRSGSTIYLENPGNIYGISNIFYGNKGILGGALSVKETSQTLF